MQENLKAFESERSQIVQSDSVKLLRQKASDAKVCGGHANVVCNVLVCTIGVECYTVTESD